jgi:hypothetical protein
MLREMVWCSSRTMLKLILMTDANVPGKLNYHLYHCGPHNESKKLGIGGEYMYGICSNHKRIDIVEHVQDTFSDLNP